jgi:hypothetical protein
MRRKNGLNVSQDSFLIAASQNLYGRLSLEGTVTLADFQRKFAESLIDFIEIFVRDLVDFSPMQRCRKLRVRFANATEQLIPGTGLYNCIVSSSEETRIRNRKSRNTTRRCPLLQTRPIASPMLSRMSAFLRSSQQPA